MKSPILTYASLGLATCFAMNVGFAGASAHNHSHAVNLAVKDEGGNKSSPLLYGIMFEEMDRSGDGGIHGQLLQNNGFQGKSLGMTAYKSVGDVDISQDHSKPVSKAITSSLQVAVPKNATKFVGFANTGYKGVPVKQAKYKSSFYMKGNYSGTVTLQLVGSHSGTIYADHNLTVKSSDSKFTPFETSFQSKASPDGENEWRLTFDGSKVAGNSLNFGLVQLFPPTFHDRENGLRDDLATVIDKVKPKFLRFPGGNNLEGVKIDSRWKWNTTIGPVVDRPGREADWGYPNTDALGLDEYMQWCEDMGMAPLLGVWAGKSYGGILSGEELEPYVQDTLNELEYLLGDSTTTHYGRLRAKNGRTEPWKLNYVEIGNEDQLTGGCDTYPERFNQFYKAIHDHYPHITIVVSNADPSCLPSQLPKNVILDVHFYLKDDQIVDKFNQWDNQPRNQSVMVGEYGCRNTTQATGVYWSYMRGSCSEAVYMIGLERNSDIVKMAAYAPLLAHREYISWSPTLYGFDSRPDSITPSTSYYVQKMFATNKGDTVLPVSSSTGFGPLYWVATKTDSKYYVKLANYGSVSKKVDVSVPGTEKGKLEMLSGPEYHGNTPMNVKIETITMDVSDANGKYTIHMEPWAVAVLAVS